MSLNLYFDTMIRILSEQFCRIEDSSYSLNKYTKCKFSRVNIENSRTTIIYNSEVIFLDDHQHTE